MTRPRMNISQNESMLSDISEQRDAPFLKFCKEFR